MEGANINPLKKRIIQSVSRSYLFKPQWGAGKQLRGPTHPQEYCFFGVCGVGLHPVWLYPLSETWMYHLWIQKVGPGNRLDNTFISGIDILPLCARSSPPTRSQSHFLKHCSPAWQDVMTPTSCPSAIWSGSPGLLVWLQTVQEICFVKLNFLCLKIPYL